MIAAETVSVERDPVLAFEARQDTRDARKLARLQAAGHTHSRCNICGAVRPLAWDNWECNEIDYAADDGLCGGGYRAEGGAA